MKLEYEKLIVGLDQLYFSSALDRFDTQTRVDAIEAFVRMSGWSWESITDHLIEETLPMENNNG